MFRRPWNPATLVLWVMLAISCALAGPGAAQAQPICTGELYRRWRFHAGAPLAHPPAVTANGHVAVATHEGYLHALDSSGAFAWSYTVDGSLLAGVFVDAANRFMAASSASKIYALAEDGAPHWVFSAPTKPERTGVDPGRGIFFFTRGKGLYAVSSRAGLLWSMPLGAKLDSELFVDQEGAAWLLTENATLQRIRTPYFSAKWPLPEAVRPRLLDAWGGLGLVLDRGTLQVIDREGKQLWQHDGVIAAALTRDATPPKITVLTSFGQVQWLAHADGKLLQQTAFDGLEPSALSATTELSFVAEQSGRLSVISKAGLLGQCRISAAAVLRPVFDAKRRQVIVAAGDGELAAIVVGGPR